MTSGGIWVEWCFGYSSISDEELDRFVSQYTQTHGEACGRSMVSGCLKFIGINVQQHRGIQSFARVDPRGSRTRWFLIIRRSKYHVPTPKDL